MEQTTSGIQVIFSPLEPSDFTMLHEWLNREHVSRWWGGPQTLDQVKLQFQKSICNPFVNPFIVSVNHRRVGYIQSYEAARVGGGWWKNESKETWGVDLFIGEIDMIGKGIGALFAQQFTDQLLLGPDVSCIISDPDPSNVAAIKCYEKAGFSLRGEEPTPDGLALIMVKR